MQHKITAELKRTAVESFHLDLDVDRFSTEDFPLKAAGRAELRMPESSEDRTFLLVSNLEIRAEAQPELFHAVMVINFFFEASQKVEDYDEIVQKQCLPVIQKRQSELTNKVLEDIGYPSVSVVSAH